MSEKLNLEQQSSPQQEAEKKEPSIESWSTAELKKTYPLEKLAETRDSNFTLFEHLLVGSTGIPGQGVLDKNELITILVDQDLEIARKFRKKMIDEKGGFNIGAHFVCWDNGKSAVYETVLALKDSYAATELGNINLADTRIIEDGTGRSVEAVEEKEKIIARYFESTEEAWERAREEAEKKFKKYKRKESE